MLIFPLQKQKVTNFTYANRRIYSECIKYTLKVLKLPTSYIDLLPPSLHPEILSPPLLHPTPNNTKPTYERTETTFICVTGITKMRPQKLPEIFFKMMVMTYRNQVPLFPFITWWRILKLAKEATNM